ncbi:MAG: ABC transporter permease [Chloroflexia bacterium]
METLFGVSMDTVMVVALGISVVVLAVVGFLAWRNPIILRLALRNIPRRRAQTVLIVFGLMLATLLVTAAFGTGDTMTYSMRQAFTAGLGGTDITVKRTNPVFSENGPPDFNRAQPTFDRKVMDDLKAKVGQDDRIDGWSGVMEQMAPVVDVTSKQASGQTFVEGVGSDIKETLGDLHPVGGGVFDVASLGEGEIVLDQAAADKLNAQIGHDVQVVVGGKPSDFKVREIVQNTSPSSMFPVVFVNLAQMQTLFNAPGQISEIDISLKGGDLDGVKYSKEVAQKLEGLVDTKAYTVAQAKKSALDMANLFGNLFTTIFVGTALFSIAAGILLIFLIFAMLAAERKSEMGMARAVGTQRGHLTQMFVFEGLAYDLAAAAVGAALGVVVGFGMVGIIASAFNTFGFQLTPHMEGRSLVVAYCLGMLVTFFTVAISATRVSRLNIVAAIRNIPDMPRPDRRLGQLLMSPFEMLRQGKPGQALGALFVLGWSLLKSGPVTGALGLALLALGWSTKSGLYFHLGATLIIIALGLTIRWILGLRRVRPATRDRIAFTFMGLGLLIYWALPVDSLHKWFGVPEFGFGIEFFFVGGIAMVAGAVWAIMYNTDLLLKGMSFVLGRTGRMRPVLKTAVAYPASSIFRTGMTLAMFALIIFTLIVISVLNGTSAQADPARPEVTGGYQIEAPVSYANPISDIKAGVEGDPTLKGKFESVTGQTMLPLEMRQPGAKAPAVPPTAEQIKTQPSLAEGWRYYNARLVDETFLKDNEFMLGTRAKGYASDREVWDAIAKDPTLAVVDYLPVVIGESGRGGGFGPPRFSISGVKSSDKTMDPVEVEMRVPGAPGANPVKVKVIGVLNDAASYTGMYVSEALAKQVSPAPLPVSTYFFRVKAGEDPEQMRRALGTAFMSNGMEPVVIAEELRKQQAAGNTIIGLLQGFMTLGLLVGIAALGVISTRAVVERRQQIGVLRAIGYQRGMIAMSFLLESSFIALLGIIVGVVLGLILSYNLVSFLQQSSPTVKFDVPWLQILGIVVLAYVASLITTVMPARQASQIYPAEALRYE